jgi:hypothetical protein
MSPIPAWSPQSNQNNAYFGRHLQTAGDVNGDGYSDVLVAAPAYDNNGQTDEGHVFLFLGSASGLATAASWSVEGDQIAAGLGSALAAAGDVNGDGYDDVLVAASSRDNGEADEGQVFLYLGSAAGLATTPAWMAEGNATFTHFGGSVAGAGDVNGDGYADVLVGHSWYGNGQSNEGRALLYLGSSSGLGTSPAWAVEGNQNEVYFGTSVASAGDVNGDGYADVLVGAPWYSNGQTEEGAAFVYHGSASGLGTTPARILDSNQSFSQFGASVSTAGDTNADGHADVIVGAPAYTNGETSEGAAYVFRGSSAGLLGTPQWILEGNQAPTPGFNDGTSFGASVSTAGDVNGDGFADLVVGAPYYDNGVKDDGSAFVYLVGGSTALPALYIRPQGNQLNSALGSAVATAGDVNGDGFSDVLVGQQNFDAPETNEGRALLYLGAAADPPTVAQWSRVGGANGLQLGLSVASAGDVNGDGFSDVIVGTGSNVGNTAYVHLGSFQGLEGGTGTTLTGTSGEWFGHAVASAGDVNGDGYGDVIVGAPRHTNTQQFQGRASIYLGSASGLTTVPAWTVRGEYANDALGTSVASAGDVNGDGFSDVIVAAFVDRAYLYLGSPGGPSTTPAWSTSGLLFRGLYGPVVAPAGDVNGDGYSDVLVTSPGNATFATGAGAAYVFHGSPSGLPSTPSWTDFGQWAYAAFGASAATAGDVNGDGYADIIVAAPYGPEAPAERGRVWVYLGSPAGVAALPQFLVILDPAGTAFLGVAVSAAGDVDGDGFGDVLIGSPSWTTSVGRALAYAGSSTGMTGRRLWEFQWSYLGEEYGRSVASAGDVNGDGFADILIGVPKSTFPPFNFQGAAFVHMGNAIAALGSVAPTRHPRQEQAQGTAPISLLGRSDVETGFRLRAIGRTAAGRGRIRLEWEAKPVGTPFDGTGVGSTGPIDTGTPAGGRSEINFNEVVSGLGEGARIHWRARTVSRDPFFPRSLWLSVGGNTITETKLRTAGCVDDDADGFGALADPSCPSATVDCADRNALVWSLPGETRDLLFGPSKTTLLWSSPTEPGTLEPLSYDTLRGNLPTAFLTCVPSVNPLATTNVDAAVPSPGQMFSYLTRARNACPAGTGSVGTTSAGTPRVVSACP